MPWKPFHLVGIGLLSLAITAPAGAQIPAVPPAGRPGLMATPAEADRVLARIDGEPVFELDLAVAADRSKLQLPDDLADRADILLAHLIDVRVASRAAVSAGLADDPSIRRRSAYERSKLLYGLYMEEAARSAVTPDAVRSAYADETALENRERVRLRQILLAREADIRTAEARLKRGESFAKVAAALSVDEASRQDGGELGVVSRRELEPEVARAAFGLKPNELSGPVRSRLGWHLLQALERSLEPLRTFAEARAPIEERLGRPAKERAIRALRAAARIERSPAPNDDPEEVLARVDGQPIVGAELALAKEDQTDMTYVDAAETDGRPDELGIVTDLRLVSEAAVKAGLDGSRTARSSLRYDRDRLLADEHLRREAGAAVSDEAVRDFHRAEFVREGVRYRYVDSADRAAAARVAARLRRGEDMARVVKDVFKKDPPAVVDSESFVTRAAIGDLGILFSLRPNEVAGPIRSFKTAPWSVFQLVARRDKPPLDEAIAAGIREHLTREAREEILLSLRSASAIELVGGPAEAIRR